MSSLFAPSENLNPQPLISQPTTTAPPVHASTALKTAQTHAVEAMLPASALTLLEDIEAHVEDLSRPEGTQGTTKASTSLLRGGGAQQGFDTNGASRLYVVPGNW